VGHAATSAASGPATADQGKDAAGHAPTAAKPAVAATPPATAASNVLKVEASTVLPAPSGVAGLAPVHAAVGRTHTDIDPYAEAKRMRDLHIFMGIYFCLTGLHGFHVLGGIVVISWLLYGAIKGRYNSQYYTPVDLVGLYWHIVDLVWIFLFPLLYLI
jgi:cytochrome c oxidase subunit 3